MKTKVKLTQKCVASHYEMPNEKIIEFSFPDKSGGLISFITLSDGTNHIVIYNQDKNVKVDEGKRIDFA